MIFPAAVLLGTLTMAQWQGLVEPTVVKPVRSVWDDLADCETGEWVNGGEVFVEDSARWDADDGLYEGGLQFHPETWDAYAPAGYPASGFLASRSQQIVVAEHVLEAQGWQAWPTCSRLIGVGSGT